jgi:DNA-binding transcriptional LysR family regulator
VVPTAAGLAYYDAVAPAVAHLDEADDAARAHGAAPRGLVRLTVPPDLQGLPQALSELLRRHPGLRIEVDISSRSVDLVGEGFDLAIRGGRLEDSSLIARRVGTAVLKLCASPAYLRRRGRPKTLADLTDHALIVRRAVGGRSTLGLTDKSGAAVTVDVTGALVVDDIGFCRVAAEAGAGITLLPSFTLDRAVADGRLEVVLKDLHQEGASLAVVMPSARQVPARVAVVRDFLVETLSKEFGRPAAS